jgi:hypothetical protein
MKFQKGHKLAKGGARPGAGRKSKQFIANRAEAIKIAEEKLNQIFGDLMGVAEKVCKGLKRKKFYPPHIVEILLKDVPKNKRKSVARKCFYWETEYDTATLRFLFERYIAPARQGIDISLDSPEEFWRAYAAAKATPQRPPIETKAIPEPENGKVH